jgi:hypothetical protein
MWLSGYEKLAAQLKQLKSPLVGNIVFMDPNPNLVSLYTIVRWLIFGKKEGIVNAGIAEKDFEACKIFGRIIGKNLKEERIDFIGDELHEAGSEKIKPALMVLERRGNKLFSIWAKMINAAGKKGSPGRTFLLFLFTVYLPVGIMILSPVSDLVVLLTYPFFRKKYMGLKNHYYSIRNTHCQ